MSLKNNVPSHQRHMRSINIIFAYKCLNEDTTSVIRIVTRIALNFDCMRQREDGITHTNKNTSVKTLYRHPDGTLPKEFMFSA